MQQQQTRGSGSRGGRDEIERLQGIIAQLQSNKTSYAKNGE